MNIFDIAMAKKLGGGNNSSSSGSGVTIKNQNKTFTENGSYAADSGYTGLGVVTVAVPVDSKIDELISRTVTEMTEKDFEGATSIGASAFRDCTNLVSVIMPTSIKSIGDYAFEGCTNLNIYYMGTRAEWEAISIGSNNNLPQYYYYSEDEPTASGFWHYVDGVPTIWAIEDTSEYSKGLAYTLNGTSYTVSGIGDCTDVDIVIPNVVEGILVTSIGDKAFKDCRNITSVTIPDNVTSIGYKAFENCYGLTSVTIPDSVTSIGREAFAVCIALTSVKIPSKVTSIGSDAFFSCTSVQFYDFTACTAVPTLGSKSAFNAIPATCQIRVPASLYDEWIAATNWSNYADKIVAV